MRIVKWFMITLLWISTQVNALPGKSEVTVYTEDKPAVMLTQDQSQFVIKLKSNPTTGYAWFLREYNPNLLEPVKHVFDASTDKKLMGAPGYELWTFRVKPGSFVVPQMTMVRFVYARPWETEDNATQVVFKVSLINTRH